MQNKQLKVGMEILITSTKITDKLYATNDEMRSIFISGLCHTITRLSNNNLNAQLDNKRWLWALEDLQDVNKKTNEDFII